MFVSRTSRLTQALVTVPEVRPVVRPTLVTAVPTIGLPVRSSLVIRNLSVPFHVNEPKAGRAMNPLLTVTEGPEGWGTRTKALSL